MNITTETLSSGLLDRCREGNIKLNKKKFIFKCDGVQFIGHRLTKEGLKPDPAKLRAILNMKKPDDVAAVHRPMGLVKYLSKFLSDLSQISTVAHKGHYALFHNTFRMIKYAFQIMHNTFPILRNTF